jgi:hypothetical protein
MSETVLADFRLPRALRRVLEPMARIVCTDEVDRLGLTQAVVDHVELSLRSIPFHLRTGLVAGITAFELGAMTFPSSFGRPFSRLPEAKQDAYFASWWHSPLFPLRQFTKGIKGLIAMGYFEQPVILNRMEYHPEAWIAEVAARRVRDYSADIAAQDKMVLERDPLVPANSLTKKVRHDQAA